MTQDYYEEEVYEEGFEEGPYVDDAEIQRILAEYHRKQMIENMTGPGVSLVLHVIFLTLMFVFIVTKPRRMEPPIVVEMTEIEEVELEPEVIEEIEEIEEETLEEEAPTTEPSDAPSEQVGAEDSLLDVSDDAPMTDDNVDADEVLDVVRTDSPLKFTGPLGGRSNAGRRNAVRKYGGSSRGQRAVNRALRWLAKVQNEDGSWGENNGHQQAFTGIALLVFLAHGETPLSEQYGKTVQNAMRWLAYYANSEDLKKKTSKKHGGAYGHGMAAYAISEAYAMTKIPFMQTAMENAIAIIVDGQQANGGFGYGYEPKRWDMSVAGWQMQALKAARVAGSTNPKLLDAIKKSIHFCRTTADAKGGYGYANNEGGNASGAKDNMTGVGIVALQLLGAGRDGSVQDAMDTVKTKRLEAYTEIKTNPAKWDEIGGKYLYGFYYDTQAVFNSQDTGEGKNLWKQWRAVFESVLIRAQNPEGYWQCTGHRYLGEKLDGRIFATCLSALQLEVYYRYLPTFDIKKMDKAAKEDQIGIGNVGAGDDAGGDGLVIEID